ncbi:MAG: hypothetical protein WC718_15275 [Phycisphaerales bacterium]
MKKPPIGQAFWGQDGTLREVLGEDSQGRLIVRTTTTIEPENLRHWIRRHGAKNENAPSQYVQPPPTVTPGLYEAWVAGDAMRHPGETS